MCIRIVRGSLHSALSPPLFCPVSDRSFGAALIARDAGVSFSKPLVRRCAVRPRRRRARRLSSRSISSNPLAAQRCSFASQAWSVNGHAPPPLVVARLAESVTNAVARRASAGRVVESTTTSGADALLAYQQLGSAGRVRGPDLGHASAPSSLRGLPSP